MPVSTGLADGKAVSAGFVFFAQQSESFSPDFADAVAADFSEGIEAVHIVFAGHDLAGGEDGHT